jgi:adenine deaminase
MHKHTLQKLFQVVKEAEPADTIITNGRVINVFTNGVDEGQAITVTT